MARGMWKAEIRVEEDFLHFEDNIAATGVAASIVWGTGYVSVGNVGLVSVNEGSLAWTIDEPGGILAITTDTADDDNACLIAGRFEPGDGGCECEFRFKFDGAATTFPAIFCGFSETMAFDTPVMPAEFATTVMTYNGTGGMVGAQMDIDGNTDDFRACAGDAAAATGGAGNGVRAQETLTADEWYIVRTEIGTDGNARVYVGHKGDGMDLIAVSGAVQGNSFNGAVVTPGDQQYAVLMAENRTGAARVLEVDYAFGHGWRDWSNT